LYWLLYYFVLFYSFFFFFFFFQAEDGIRDATVTGVQTCALPICPRVFFKPPPGATLGDDTDLQFDGQGRLFWSNRVGASGSGISVSQIDPATGATITSTLVTRGSDRKSVV